MSHVRGRCAQFPTILCGYNARDRRLPADDTGERMDAIEATAKALQAALTKYAGLDPSSTARASVAQQIFGVTASRRLLPMLDELARSVQPVQKT